MLLCTAHHILSRTFLFIFGAVANKMKRKVRQLTIQVIEYCIKRVNIILYGTYIHVQLQYVT